MHRYAKGLRPTLANKVYEIRTNRHYTQEDMAEHLRISPRSYSNLERGINGCSAMTLIYIMNMMTEPEKKNLFWELEDFIEQMENLADFMPPESDPNGTPGLR